MKHKEKDISPEQDRLAEIQYLSEQVLFDLKKDYRRAMSNGLTDKAYKILKNIEEVEKCR